MSSREAQHLGDDWDRHWSEYNASAEENPAQRYRRRILLDLLKQCGCGPESRILDIGSGLGDLAAEVHRIYATAAIAGVELSATGVDVASRKVPGARFMQRDLLLDAAPPADLRRWAQFAICSEVLEHVDEPALLLANASQYLASGCLLLVTVPGGPRSAFDKHIGHRAHFSADSLKRILVEGGFRVITARRAGFPFFNLYRLTVLLRGKGLVADAAGSSGRLMGLLARGGMKAFRLLFRMNLPNTPWGWQLVAVARWPGAAHEAQRFTGKD